MHPTKCYISTSLAVPDALFNELAERIPEDRLRGVKEIYVHFWREHLQAARKPHLLFTHNFLHTAIESHVFSLRSPLAFRKFYAPPARSAREGVDIAEDELRFTSQSVCIAFLRLYSAGLTSCHPQLVNALVLLGEYPLIRYYNPNTKPLGVGAAYNEHITRRLAEMVQREMDEYCRNNTDFPVSQPATLPILASELTQLYSQNLSHPAREVSCSSQKDQSI